jgi:hypothetical protein
VELEEVAPLEEALQEEEEALQEEALQEEAPQEEALQEGAPQAEDLLEEHSHQHNKPKWHNQYPSRPVMRQVPAICASERLGVVGF